VQTTYQSLTAFISTPKDVSREREIAKQVVERINLTCKETLGLEMEIISWDQLPPAATKLPKERIQDVLDQYVAKCNIFILILYKRYGTKEEGHSKSNTEREVDIAVDLLKREKKIMFLSYFRKLPPSDDYGPQESRVRALRKRLEKMGIWYKEYETTEEFEHSLLHDLYRTVLSYRLSTTKHKALKCFWQFGFPERITHPILAVIYPTTERIFMGPRDDANVWLNRLGPNVVFEDFKALEKIEKTLRLIGVSDFKLFNTVTIPPDIHLMNRLWMCLPHSTKGIAQIQRYEDRSCFRLIRKQDRTLSYLLWRRSPRGQKYITVRSPLAKYLAEQGSHLNIAGEWNPELSHIVAKDYAILARFRDLKSDVVMVDGFLKDYFLAGLRGLGTWGAAWFIDRKYDHFMRYRPDQDIQMLIEVEYREGRVSDVRDVSAEPQSYFDQENNLATIRKTVKNYHHT